GVERLKLDRIRPARRCRVHERPRQVQVAVMVDACFRDHKAWRARPDAARADIDGSYHAVQPPSTCKFCPVTYSARSLARYAAAPFISCSVAIRRSGVRAAYRATNASGWSRKTPPGEIAFTRISGASSVAINRVNCSRPPLLVA